MDYQNNIDGEERQVKSASKFLGIELIFIIIFISLIAFALNYFNLLPLSQIFPGQLGWLPRREVLKFEALAPRDKIITYSSEVLNPEYLPKDFSGELRTEVIPQWEQKAYYMDFIVNEVPIRIQYFESIQGSNFEKDGIPLDIDIVIDPERVNAREVAPDNSRNYLGSFFNFTEDDILWREFKLPSGAQVIETSWENSDGTIETRGSSRYGQTAPDGTVNIRNAACRLFQRYPAFKQQTCF